MQAMISGLKIQILTVSASSGRAVVRRAVRTTPVLGLLGLLAACAGQPQTGPSVPVAEEAAQYRAHARSYYAPPGPPEDPWGPYIQEAAKRFDVPEVWVRAVMQQESGGRLFHNGSFVTSAPGAMGLMQLMPPTYDEMRAAYNLGSDAYEPHDNIMAGTAYLRQMYDTYGSPGFLAAYNAGPGRLEDFITRNRILPRETRNYVAAIGRKIVGISPANRSQADILVASHDSMAQSYQPILTNSATSAVSTAWANRSAGATATQPVQVASASATVGGGSSTYGADWHPLARNTATTTARNDVSSVWAKRLAADGQTESAASAPVQVAQAVDSSDPIPNPTEDTSSSDDAVTSANAPVLRVAAVTTPQQTAPVTQPASRHLRFVSPAMAEPAPLQSSRVRANTPKNWAIQVGAFGSASLAQQATGHAKTKASSALSGAKAQVATVQVKKSRLYRARLTNLSHDDAVAACRSLSGCVVVSPTSQS
ncbi:hypothetical protein ACI01nite_06560 [Acetobacter cibinongensis]|uniref:Murein transglycosylase n=2 Tax=Acetobacter cibinongensis TaxID=146475 RepID=A0A0D6N3T4_9PROT|nr:murein transglycosylase [Acetobacter cibinongensis]GBQ18773.1 murein transglycosylase [Acetobacter cibinongensis NRIC 0482]GEL58054.1 hypothetical protein ACI01nite_06560 [Acetobacter cibinongensis]